MFPGLSRYFPFLSPATCQPDAMQSPLSSPFARENPFPVAISTVDICDFTEIRVCR